MTGKAFFCWKIYFLSPKCHRFFLMPSLQYLLKKTKIGLGQRFCVTRYQMMVSNLSQGAIKIRQITFCSRRKLAIWPRKLFFFEKIISDVSKSNQGRFNLLEPVQIKFRKLAMRNFFVKTTFGPKILEIRVNSAGRNLVLETPIPFAIHILNPLDVLLPLSRTIMHQFPLETI